MAEVSITELRRDLRALLDAIERGTTSEIHVTRRGRRIATVIPATSSEPSPLALREVPISVADDFDEPLADLWEAVES